jgi:hypothetical protein
VFQTRQRQESFLQETFKPSPMSPTQPPNQRVSRNMSTGIKHPEREAVRSTPLSVDVKNERIDTYYQSFIDMDMSNARVVRTASLTSLLVRCKILHPVRCKILRQRTPSLSVKNDVTRPLLCARITFYVTVITHGRCYARA